MKSSNTPYRLFALLLICVGSAAAQGPMPKSPGIDLDYYMFPIRPNQPNSLAGNMGELRSTHFHAGLDIRTGGRTGLPVYAAADGYISRVAVSKGGYGKAIYITHPNGETTVYAHLEKFTGQIAEYVHDKQYEAEQLHVKLFPEKGALRVNRGDIIAYSGNSGSSGGPHLHFEIRDKNQNVLNPLAYGFEEIRDTTSPIMEKLAVSTQHITARIEGKYGRREYPIRKISSNKYQIEDTVRVFGEIGFELLSYDKLDANRFKCGVSEINFSIDDEPVFSQHIEKLNFASQRNILVHYNYQVRYQTHDSFHKLYRANGNKLDFYTTNKRDGKVLFEENCMLTGRIEIKDIYGNTSELIFPIKCENKSNEVNVSQPQGIQLFGNVLAIQKPTGTSIDDNEKIQLTTQEKTYSLSPSYHTQSFATYLWDMTNGLPTQIDLCDSLISTDFKAIVPNGKEYTFFGEGLKIEFFKKSLFDTLCFTSNTKYDSSLNSTIYSIGDPSLYPVRSNFRVTLAQQDPLKKKHVYQISDGGYSFVGGKWQDENLEFYTRSFGEYIVLTDTVPPFITPVLVEPSQLKFVIDDALSGIKDFSVWINDKWLLMDYDYKTKAIWSTESIDTDDTSSLIAKVMVEDNAGNIHIQNYTIPQ